MDRQRSTKKSAKRGAAVRRGQRRRSGERPKPGAILPELTAGRDHGQVMLYDPNAAYNYKSEMARYEKAIALTPEVMRPDVGGYRVPSAGRSDRGYWSPGAVRVYCQCGGTSDPYGTILQFDIGPGLHTLVVQSADPVTLMRWSSEPNCEFTDPELVPVATATPESGAATFSLNVTGTPFYSFQTGSGYSLAFRCARVINLEPDTTIIQLL